MEVRAITLRDTEAWLRLRASLWPHHSLPRHRADIDAFFDGSAAEPLAVLIATDPHLGVVGFVELSIRPHAEGCTSSRVAYVEGWFVTEPARGRGIGARLMSGAEAWARAKGCTELASDTELGNEASVLAHRALGFEETRRLVCFRKSLMSEV